MGLIWIDGPTKTDTSNIAKTMADLVTPKQMVAIRAIANSQGVNPTNECIRLLGCRPEELSRSAASRLIDHLKRVSSRMIDLGKVG